MDTRPTGRPGRSGGELRTSMNKYIVYILKSSDGKLYKGVTKDLPRRFLEHKAGKTITTRRMKNLEVIYTEEYDDWQIACRREKYLKSAAGRKFLKKRLPPS